MALVVTGLVRSFNFKKDGKTVELTDFNPKLSPEEIMQFYAGQHEELTTATIAGPKIDGDKAVYEFKATVGVKG